MGWIIYFIGMVDSIKALLLTLAIVGGIVHGVVVLAYAMENAKMISTLKRHALFTMLWLFIGFLYAVIPSSKTVAAIYFIPKVVENEQVQKLPEKALELFNLKLDAWIEDVKAENAPQQNNRR